MQPRPRAAATRPAQSGLVPVRVEHEYQRKGALNLFAAFDTRSGEVFGVCRRRKRQVEFIELLEEIDEKTPAKIKLVHIICDNVSIHHGKNQVEQWFSILQRKRFAAPNFADVAELEQKVLAFISEWNDVAHPFNWTRASFDKVLAKIDAGKAAA